MLNALVTSAWTDNLREIREDVRRVLVVVLLTVSGIWHALALALDGLARGLDGECACCSRNCAAARRCS